MNSCNLLKLHVSEENAGACRKQQSFCFAVIWSKIFGRFRRIAAAQRGRCFVPCATWQERRGVLDIHFIMYGSDGSIAE